MDNTQLLLQVSAKLYNELTEIPSGENRDEFIQSINDLLEERGQIIEQLKKENFIYDDQSKAHRMLKELNEGILKRLHKVKSAVQDDMKTLQNAKKNEKKYMNPYSNVQVMDGRYYDKKK